MCVLQSSHFWSHTLVRKCTCISTCIYVNLTPNITSNPYAYIHGNIGCTVFVQFTSFLLPHLLQNVYMHQYMHTCPLDSPCQIHPLHIVTWKHGCPCVAMCPPVTSLQVPHLYLECIHASVHVFMST